MTIPEEQLRELREIQALLDEAYDHYFEHSDGYSKLSEGAISVNFNNYFDRKEGERSLEIRSLTIFSYVLGPQRTHDFATTTEALVAVRIWHQDEMARTYNDGDDRFLPVEKILNSSDGAP